MGPVFENLSDSVFHFARTKPDAPAIHEGKRTLSYREFADLVGKAAVHLRDLGIKPRELVGVALPTDIAHLVLLYGLMRIGAVPVDIPMRRPSPVDPFGLFGVKRVMTVPDAKVANVTLHTIDAGWLDKIAAGSGDYRFEGPPETNYLFSITSGSTGMPRGVITSQREWNERYRSAAMLLPDVINAEHPPTLLVIGEISFSGFFFFITNQIYVGGPVVLVGVSENLDAFIEAINAWDNTAFLATPAMCREMLTRATNDGVLFAKVKAMIVGAAPLFPDEKRAIVQRLTPNLYEVYGNAATGFITALPPGEILRKADSVGRLAPGIGVDVVDARGQILAPGVVGHIRCRGSGVSQRAHGADGNAPGASDALEGFRDGSYYPGDIGAFDADGFLHLKGRVSDLIRRRGVTIYPPEVEAVLAKHPGVAEAAVVGVRTGTGDDEVVGVIVPRGKADLDALAQHCRAHLPPEKCPGQLFWVTALPKTGPGKVDAPMLKASILKRMTAPA